MTQKWPLVRFPSRPVSTPTLAKLTKTKQRQWRGRIVGFSIGVGTACNHVARAAPLRRAAGTAVQSGLARALRDHLCGDSIMPAQQGKPGDRLNETGAFIAARRLPSIR
jgi:hypothetical protein